MEMNSPLTINYETRPCKFAERSMLLTAFQRICNKFSGEYQYVGFGGLSFTDFKLFHRGLHISKMHSIEGGTKLSEKRLKYNRPYSFVNIHLGLSSDVLPLLNLSQRSIVWLDYDGYFDKYIFEDIFKVFDRLPAGSIYLMTCNIQMPFENGKDNPSVKEFKDYFEQYAPFNISPNELSKSERTKIFRNILRQCADSALQDRNIASSEELKFIQLFDISYTEGENSAKMYTFGGVIVHKDCNVADLDVQDLPFIYSNQIDSYPLVLPKITFKEALLVNQYIDCNVENYPKALCDIVHKSQFEIYCKTYKYLPNFVDVHM